MRSLSAQKYEKQIKAITSQHRDYPIVNSRNWQALAPRLIAALGTQRERFPDVLISTDRNRTEMV